jgi:hypothetical protein
VYDDARPEYRQLGAYVFVQTFLDNSSINLGRATAPESSTGNTDHSTKECGRATVLSEKDVFAENMEEDKIKPYLGTLLPALVQVFLDHQTTFYALRLCLSSIGSIVTSSRQGFAVYPPDVSTLLLKVLDEKDAPEIMVIKAEAI